MKQKILLLKSFFKDHNLKEDDFYCITVWFNEIKLQGYKNEEVEKIVRRISNNKVSETPYLSINFYYKNCEIDITLT